MAYVKFNDKEAPIKAVVVPVGANLVSIHCEEEPNLTGFSLFLDENMEHPMDNGEYQAFVTLYRQFDGGYFLSNDGSVWVDPKSLPVEVTFSTSVGGYLEGMDRQEAKNWEELSIPVPVADEGWRFMGWNHEIPESGLIVESGLRHFVARFEDFRVHFECTGGGYLEGETVQIVEKYEDLVIPEPVVSNLDYKFMGWSPEIPENGELELNNLTFYAVFESTISERLAAMEGDMKALNDALGGE